jgi:hypothetical protein
LSEHALGSFVVKEEVLTVHPENVLGLVEVGAGRDNPIERASIVAKVDSNPLRIDLAQALNGAILIVRRRNNDQW